MYVQITFRNGDTLDGNHMTKDDLLKMSQGDEELTDKMGKTWADDQSNMLNGCRQDNNKMLPLMVKGELYIIHPDDIRYGRIIFE